MLFMCSSSNLAPYLSLCTSEQGSFVIPQSRWLKIFLSWAYMHTNMFSSRFKTTPQSFQTKTGSADFVLRIRAVLKSARSLHNDLVQIRPNFKLVVFFFLVLICPYYTVDIRAVHMHKHKQSVKLLVDTFF